MPKRLFSGFSQIHVVFKRNFGIFSRVKVHVTAQLLPIWVHRKRPTPAALFVLDCSWISMFALCFCFLTWLVLRTVQFFVCFIWSVSIKHGRALFKLHYCNLLCSISPCCVVCYRTVCHHPHWCHTMFCYVLLCCIMRFTVSCSIALYGIMLCSVKTSSQMVVTTSL